MVLNRFIVLKPDSSVAEVILVRHKGADQYSFVNLTKGHICPCKFDTVDEAIRDLNERKKMGRIWNYWRVGWEEDN